MRKIITICLTLAFGANVNAQVDIEKNLVAKYPMNGNILDVSPNSSASKLFGPTLATDSKGIANQAYQFDGVDDYIELDKFKMQQSFSFGFWLNSTDTIRTQAWVASNTANHNNIDQADNLLLMGQYSKKVILRFKFGMITADTLYKGWAHYALACKKLTESSSEITLYKNGKLKLIDTIPSVFDVTGTYAWCLGQEWDNNGGTMVKSDFFKGSIDDFWVYNRVLSKDEINNLISPVQKLSEKTFGACDGVDAILSMQDPTVKWFNADKSTKLGTGEFNAGKLSVGSYTYFASKTVNGIESIPTLQKLEVKKAERLGSIIGESEISSNDIESSFSITAIPQSSNYVWSIDPATAGTLTSDNSSSTIKWSNALPKNSTVRVVADIECAASGISANSVSDTATLSLAFTPTTFKNTAASNKLCAWPNPSNGSFSFVSDAVTSAIELRVYDLSGVLVLTKSVFPNLSFDCMLPSGDYIVVSTYKIGTNNITQTDKITLQ